jgi:hypothetical protein
MRPTGDECQFPPTSSVFLARQNTADGMTAPQDMKLVKLRVPDAQMQNARALVPGVLA